MKSFRFNSILKQNNKNMRPSDRARCAMWPAAGAAAAAASKAAILARIAATSPSWPMLRRGVVGARSILLSSHWPAPLSSPSKATLCALVRTGLRTLYFFMMATTRVVASSLEMRCASFAPDGVGRVASTQAENDSNGLLRCFLRRFCYSPPAVARLHQEPPTQRT